jgi:hypothetical protein
VEGEAEEGEGGMTYDHEWRRSYIARRPEIRQKPRCSTPASRLRGYDNLRIISSSSTAGRLKACVGRQVAHWQRERMKARRKVSDRCTCHAGPIRRSRDAKIRFDLRRSLIKALVNVLSVCFNAAVNRVWGGSAGPQFS